MDIEQFLESSPAPVTLADETLVDYLAARLRAIEPMLEPAKQHVNKPLRTGYTDAGLARLTADNEALIVELREVHRMTLTIHSRG